MIRLTRYTIVLSLLITGASLQAEERREIAFSDIPGYQTLKCDFHMHTVFSDGTVWPTVRVNEAWRGGLDAISITDHLESRFRKPEISGSRNRPFELAAEQAKARNILLIRGGEVTRDTPPGHFNVFFLKDADPLDTEDFYDIFEQAARQQAFVMWNHPGWKGPELGRWGEAQTRLLEQKRLHAIEICNGPIYYPEAHQWALDRNLAMLGDSDVHDPVSDLPRTPQEHRTLTLVFAGDRTVNGIREALDARRTAVWFQNQLIGRQEQLAALFPACVEVRPVHHRSRDSAWLSITNHCELDIVLERIGTGNPARINLPARATSLVRFDIQAGGLPQKASFQAVNFLISPGKALQISLNVAEAGPVHAGGARGKTAGIPAPATRPR